MILGLILQGFRIPSKWSESFTVKVALCFLYVLPSFIDEAIPSKDDSAFDSIFHEDLDNFQNIAILINLHRNIIALMCNMHTHDLS